MPEQPPTQSEPVELTERLRAAVKQNQLENVLQAAGASQIRGEATEVLGETSAAQVAELVARGNLEASEDAPAPKTELTEAAQAAFKPKKLEAAIQEADIDPQKGQETAARELARIAQEATEFAEAEERPVCHNCSAIGAARAAAQIGAPQQPR